MLNKCLKLLTVLLVCGCGATRSKMTGIVTSKRVLFDGHVVVQIVNAPDTHMWVKLNKKQLKKVRIGDRVVFHVKTQKVQHQNPLDRLLTQ